VLRRVAALSPKNGDTVRGKPSSNRRGRIQTLPLAFESKRHRTLGWALHFLYLPGRVPSVTLRVMTGLPVEDTLGSPGDRFFRESGHHGSLTGHFGARIDLLRWVFRWSCQGGPQGSPEVLTSPRHAATGFTTMGCPSESGWGQVQRVGDHTVECRRGWASCAPDL
jgi:hypothetical protein